MTAVIVAATPLAGHTMPLLEIAGRLRDRGHAVTFLGGRRFLARAEARGLRTRGLERRADFDDRRLDTEFPESSALPPGLEKINAETAQIFGDVIPDQHAALQDLLRADPDQVLITDILFGGAFPAACGVGQRPPRWVSVGIAPVYARSVDTTPFGPAPVKPGEDLAAANLAGFDAFTGAVAPAFEHIKGIIRDLGGRLGTSDWVSTLYDLPDVTAQLSVPDFEFPRSDLPDSLRFVGIVPPATADWTPPAWWSDLARAKPVILVTQGTVANRDLTHLVTPTLDALDGAECVVVAALGRDDAEVSVPANAHVVDYLPFDRLLPHVDVFVTNGGYGATQQALAAGVPVVVAGASEDKPATAARVAYHGVGINLNTGTPTSRQVREAVEQILSDPGFRARASAIATAYGRFPAIEFIEQLVLGS